MVGTSLCSRRQPPMSTAFCWRRPSEYFGKSLLCSELGQGRALSWALRAQAPVHLVTRCLSSRGPRRHLSMPRPLLLCSVCLRRSRRPAPMISRVLVSPILRALRRTYSARRRGHLFPRSLRRRASGSGHHKPLRSTTHMVSCMLAHQLRPIHMLHRILPALPLVARARRNGLRASLRGPREARRTLSVAFPSAKWRLRASAPLTSRLQAACISLTVRKSLWWTSCLRAAMMRLAASRSPQSRSVSPFAPMTANAALARLLWQPHFGRNTKVNDVCITGGRGIQCL